MSSPGLNRRAWRIRVRLVRIAAVMAISILASSCGSRSDEAAASNYVDVDAPGESDTADPAEAQSGGSGSVTVAAAAADSSNDVSLAALSDAEFAELSEVYETYLARRSEAIVGTLAPADLSEVATERAIAQVVKLHEENEAGAADDNPSAVSSLMEWPNLTDVEQNGEGLAFVDCTERHAVLLNGRTEVHFVTNAVEVVDDGGQWKVEHVEELQNGDYGVVEGEFGCVPPTLIGRAETVASAAIREAADATTDPRAVLERGLIPEITGTAREDLELALAALDEANLRRTPDEEVTMAIVGMDVNRPDYTVVVSVCRHYPNGRFYVDATSGDAQPPDIVAGGSEEEWLFIQLEPVASGSQSADAVVAVESQPTVHCQEG